MGFVKKIKFIRGSVLACSVMTAGCASMDEFTTGSGIVLEALLSTASLAADAYLAADSAQSGSGGTHTQQVAYEPAGRRVPVSHCLTKASKYEYESVRIRGSIEALERYFLIVNSCDFAITVFYCTYREGMEDCSDDFEPSTNHNYRRIPLGPKQSLSWENGLLMYEMNACRSSSGILEYRKNGIGDCVYQ